MNWEVFLIVFTRIGGIVGGLAFGVGSIVFGVWLGENRGWKAVVAYLLAWLLALSLIAGLLFEPSQLVGEPS